MITDYETAAISVAKCWRPTVRSYGGYYLLITDDLLDTTYWSSRKGTRSKVRKDATISFGRVHSVILHTVLRYMAISLVAQDKATET